MRSSYLVTYDISNPKRLRAVFKRMRDYGDHLQLSVFECQLTTTDIVKLKHELSEIIHHQEDQVLFVNIGPSEGRGERSISSIGRPYDVIDEPCIVV